jgi:hypothetical protein
VTARIQAFAVMPEVGKVLLAGTGDANAGHSDAEYPDTLDCQFNLAGLVWRAGHEAEATELYEQTLTVCQRVLGPDDELTNMLVGVLATIHGEAED